MTTIKILRYRPCGQRISRTPCQKVTPAPEESAVIAQVLLAKYTHGAS